MGLTLAKPMKDKLSFKDSNDSISYSFSSMQGYRCHMEDYYSTRLSLPYPLRKWSYFGIYDGHNGTLVAKECSTSLLKFLLNAPEIKFLKLDQNSNPIDKAQLINGIRRGFRNFDNYLKTIPDIRYGNDHSGSTATCVFVTPDLLVFINLGDSRSILISNGECVFSTIDHKPDLHSEYQRIIESGGFVNNGRINDRIAVSRTFGDFLYKSKSGFLVSNCPEISFVRRYPIISEPYSTRTYGVIDNVNMILLASDGLYDEMSNAEIAEYLTHRAKRVDDLNQISESLLDYAFNTGSSDNITALIVYLDPQQRVNPYLQLADKEFDTRIRKILNDYINTQDGYHMTLNSLMDMIDSMNLPNVPPGGMLSKRCIVEDFLKDILRKSKGNENSLAEIRQKNARMILHNQ